MAGAALTGAGTRVALDCERRVRASIVAVRQEIVRALEGAGFKVSGSQLSEVEAKRGTVMSGPFNVKYLPLIAKVSLDRPDEEATRVVVHLGYRGISLTGGPVPMASAVARAFGDIEGAIDARLAALDPAAATVFPRPTVSGVPEHADGLLEQLGPTFATIEEKAVARADRLLSGAQRTTPAAWRAVEGVRFSTTDKIAVLTPSETQAHLAIALLVSGEPHALPPKLTDELEAFVLKVERTLGAGVPGLSRVDVSPDERKVLDFLHQQARIRDGLPVRTLHRCRDCRLEKVTNPDYERLLQRNRRLGALMGAGGVMVGRSGVSPFVLLGTLFKLKRLDPDYVCGRCQGMRADESLVTFCPGCGDLRKEAILGLCPKCHHDFRKDLGPEEFWVDPPPPPEVLAATMPLGAPRPGPNGGEVCQGCGREFTSLWRVVILMVGGDVQERFVCGTTPLCQPPSLIPAVKV